MSRLGDMIKLERTRRNLSPKQVAKLCGITENFILDVEAGKRIIADDQARRILKKIGLEHQTESDFSLDDIAAAADLAAAKAKAQEPAPKPREEAAKPLISLPAEEGGGIFLDALKDVLREVPVYDAAWKVVGHRMLPVLGGRIEGGAAEKVLYFRAPDASCRGFRILPGDLVLVVPAQSPIDGAIMLVEYKNHRALRKIKLVDENRVMLQAYEHEYSADTVSVQELSCIGRCVRLEAPL